MHEGEKLVNRSSTYRPGGVLALSFAIAALTAGAGVSSPASAFSIHQPTAAKGSPENLRMLDARVNDRTAWIHATDARPAAVQAGAQAASRQTQSMAGAQRALRRSQPALHVEASALTGGPTSVSNRTGALTGPAPGRRSEDIVRDFLRSNAALYGLGPQDLADLHALGDSAGGASGLRMLRMEQRVGGRPVFQSETRFLLDRDGRLVKSTGQFVPEARTRVDAFDPAALLDASDALAVLIQSAGRDASMGRLPQLPGEDGRVLLEADGDYVTGQVTAREVLFPLAPGLLVPAWSIVAFTNGDADWYAVVDAETGDLLWRKNIRNYVSTHDARFRVYVQADGRTPADNPAPQSPTAATVGSGLQPPGIAPTIVSMQAVMSPTASPNGWIDDCPAGICTANETQTLGNNVLACLDRVGGGDDNLCDTTASSVIDGNGRPTGNPDANGRNRDFLGTAPRDFQTNFLPPPQGGNPEAGQTSTGNGNNGTLAVDQFRRGLLTQLFYLSNWYHDELFALGFDEASGNFQRINFSGMGVGNDRVLADAQDNSSTNNANFATPPDGASGRMQMFRFTSPIIDRDSSLDSEIAIHELTHGTSNRLVGNAAGLNWDMAAGMGEGWSDFYALSLLNGTNADDPNAKYASGAYATYKLGLATFTDNYLYGIRRFPYSTDNTINPLTWADVDDVTNNPDGGIAQNPLNFNGGGGMEVHNSGEIWALSLWEVRSRVIADPNGANGDVPAGNAAMLQLVTDGLKFTPIDPSFTDARDALLDADCATNACANETWIWEGFADRGLGYAASTPNNKTFDLTASHAAMVESFSMPRLDIVDLATDVMVSDAASNANGSIDPGEVLEMDVRLTNPWRGATHGSAGGTATLSSATPGVTVHDATSTFGAIAPQDSVVGDRFVFTVDPGVPCGSLIDFTLTVTSDLGTSTQDFSLRVGAVSGTGTPVTYLDDPNPNLPIPDGSPLGLKRPLVIGDEFEIADVNLRVDSVTHTWDSDVSIMLRSPGGLGVQQVGLTGLLIGDGNADNITGMLVDDDLPVDAANDMVQAPAVLAPFTGDWLPVFNSPWTVLGIGQQPDSILAFARFDGSSTRGTWTLVVGDQASQDTGTLNQWSMEVTPVVRSCSVFTGVPAIKASKSVAGVFRVGNTVTYTVTLTNDGTAAQSDIGGDEFTDALPPSLVLVGASADSGTVLATPGAGGTVTWNGALAPLGGSVTIQIEALVGTGQQGATIANQGTARFDSDGDDTHDATVLTDDPATAAPGDATQFTVDEVSFTATKTVAGTFVPGSTVTYTVVLANTGNTASLDLTGTDFIDTLPDGLTLTGANADIGTAAIDVVGNAATWHGSVPAGSAATLTITATIDADASGTIQNQGTLLYDADLDNVQDNTLVTDDPAKPGPGDSTDFEVIGADLAIVKSNGVASLTSGATTAYTITVTNAGPQAVTGARVQDPVPAGLTAVAWNCNATGTNCPVANGTGGIDLLVDLPVGATIVLQMTATVSAASGATVTNVATVQAPAGVTEVDPIDNTSTDSDPVLAVGIFRDGFE